MKRLQRVKIWQLALVLLLSGFVTASFLRLNNVGMVERRQAVLAADEEARDGDVANRMYDLQRYVAAHMNTSTGQFDLTGQYNRDFKNALDAAIASSTSHGSVQAKVEAICRERFPSYQAGTYLQYQQCFLDEMDKYPPAPNPEDNFKPPAKELYRHSFASPRWSPDFAGFSLLFFLAILAIIIIRGVRFLLLYLLLKLRYRGIGS